MVNIKINGELIKDIELTIFDKDGTLIDLYRYWSNMIELRARSITEALGIGDEHVEPLMYAMGIDKKYGRIRKGGPVGLKKRDIVMGAAVDYLTGIGVKDGEEVCLNAFEKADSLSCSILEKIVKPIGGLFKLLAKLKNGSCKIAIATTDKEDRARITMKTLGILDDISCITGADSVKNPKPAPDMVDLITKNLGIDKAKTIMVGDATTDVDMGINAGLKASVGVLSGLTTEDELKKRTRYVITDISELEVE